MLAVSKGWSLHVFKTLIWLWSECFRIGQESWRHIFFGDRFPGINDYYHKTDDNEVIILYDLINYSRSTLTEKYFFCISVSRNSSNKKLFSKNMCIAMAGFIWDKVRRRSSQGQHIATHSSPRNHNGRNENEYIHKISMLNCC